MYCVDRAVPVPRLATRLQMYCVGRTAPVPLFALFGDAAPDVLCKPRCSGAAFGNDLKKGDKKG